MVKEKVLDELRGDPLKDPPALEAGLVSSAQTIEQYEITRYGTLKRWRTELGLTEATGLLNRAFQEKTKTDSDLIKLADASANARSACEAA